MPGDGQRCQRSVILRFDLDAPLRPVDHRQLFKPRRVVAALGETQLACEEALAIQPTPGGVITCHLFRLTPQQEKAFENGRNCWMDEPQQWAYCFQAAWALSIWALIRSPQLRHELLLGSAKMEKKRSLSSRYKKVNGLPGDQMHPSQQ